MAYELKKRGFKDVTIFEKNNYVGGKSINIKYRGIKQGLTTILFTSDYKDTLIPLLQQFRLFDNATVSTLNNHAIYPENNDKVSRTLIIT
jgi:protoporphyrinogen oxidase